jgi:hypothetical protein
MTLRLNGSTSGYTEIDAPAVAGSNTLVLPTGNGSAGNILGTDGAGNLSWVNGRMVLATAQASTSGTSVDFTGIPSWVKRVTVMFNGLSTNGTSAFLLQLGDAGGIENTGYTGVSARQGASGNAFIASTAGFPLTDTVAAANLHQGLIIVSSLGSNIWVVSGMTNFGSTSSPVTVSGGKTLSDTLTQVRITTVNGTDTFDAGTINILYE